VTSQDEGFMPNMSSYIPERVNVVAYSVTSAYTENYLLNWPTNFTS